MSCLMGRDTLAVNQKSGVLLAVKRITALKILKGFCSLFTEAHREIRHHTVIYQTERLSLTSESSEPVSTSVFHEAVEDADVKLTWEGSPEGCTAVVG